MQCKRLNVHIEMKAINLFIGFVSKFAFVPKVNLLICFILVLYTRVIVMIVISMILYYIGDILFYGK